MWWSPLGLKKGGGMVTLVLGCPVARQCPGMRGKSFTMGLVVLNVTVPDEVALLATGRVRNRTQGLWSPTRLHCLP